ncbi:spore germination protein [Aneurinibacillus tyrosinisolvens]|uniref:spore germination protein n=1 Tax=Aneurinibacillus tyrosinisolvens TaxID=1443435 RepID=UPI0009E45E94|nr:spore germination protein [Aneurinibacillus tyrosinisolvens]
MEKRPRKRNKNDDNKNIDPLKEAVDPSEEMGNTLSSTLDDNVKILKETFKNCSDVVFRELRMDGKMYGFLIFIDGMVKTDDIHNNVLRPLLPQFLDENKETIKDDILDESNIALSQLSKVKYYSDVVDNVLGANTVLLLDGKTEALVINAIGGNRRGVSEPQTEAVVRGPREGFAEGIRTNTGLIRFRVKSPRLKMEAMKIGEHTRTNVVLAYIEGVADPNVIKEARKRLSEIEIDGILETGYIEEFIEDNPHSPFPQFQYTERPDTVCGNLLEGKFAILVDGTPFVLIAPVTFWQLMQAGEDYYERYIIANMLRWLRYALMLIALFMPSLYIAVLTYHPDMLPTRLVLSIAASREAIPFPALVEALMMELAFEALREAGVRLPKAVGQGVSILGALIIGQGAVQAGIVSAPMVMVVALTGIASFTIPKYNLSIAVRMLRFPLMFLAASFGLFGIVIGGLLISIHLVNLRTFGVPYLSGVAPYNKHDIKDIFVRVPWWRMIFRPFSYSHLNRQRMQRGMKPTPPPAEE